MDQVPGVLRKALKEQVVMELTDGTNVLLCKVCNQRASGMQSMMGHLNGSGHREAAASYAIAHIHTAPSSLLAHLSSPIRKAAVDGVIRTTPHGQTKCTKCQVLLTGTRQIKDHLEGQDHKKNLQASVVAGIMSSITNKYEYVPESSDDQLVRQAVSSGVVRKTNSLTEPYLCTVCNSPCSGDQPLVQHLKGSQHKKKVSMAAVTKIPPTPTHARQDIPKAYSLGLEPSPLPVRYPDPPGACSSVPSRMSGEVSDDDFELVRKALETGAVSLTDTKAETYACNPCCKRFNSRRTLLDHLKSNQHKKKDMGVAGQSSGGLIRQPSLNLGTYSVTSTPRGLVYVFNNMFRRDSKWVREGAERDSSNLKSTFNSMGYEVNLLENLSESDTLITMRRIQNNSLLQKVDALIIFILTHGKDPYTFYTNDRGEINLFSVRRMFTDRQCPNMKGKPKIIFTNYCRGESMEKKELDSAEIDVPNDMVTVHAAAEGIMALRNVDKGTYFVSHLCDVLKKYARTLLLRDIYHELRTTMIENRSTKPMWEDYGFKAFKFNPV